MGLLFFTLLSLNRSVCFPTLLLPLRIDVLAWKGACVFYVSRFVNKINVGDKGCYRYCFPKFKKIFNWIYFCLFIYWPYYVAYETLVPWPGIEPAPPALAVWSPNHWPGKSPLPAKFLKEEIVLYLYLYLLCLACFDLQNLLNLYVPYVI